MSEQPIITRIPSPQELTGAGLSSPEPVGIKTYFGGAEYFAGDLDKFEQQLGSIIGEDEQKRQAVHTILQTGVDAETGHDLRTDSVARNVRDELEARKRLAYIAASSPDTYATLRDRGVVGFHGTRSSALAGILKTGELRSAKATHEDTSGAFMISGEHLYQKAEGQDSISFSGLSDLETPRGFAGAEHDQTKTPEAVLAELKKEAAKLGQDSDKEDAQGSRLGGVYRALQAQYTRAIQAVERNPRGLEATLLENDFPVLMGVEGDFVEAAEDNPDPNVSHARTISGQSAQAEFRPLASSIPVENLVFAVPAGRVDGMRKLLDMFGRDNAVVPIEALGPDRLNAA